MPRFCLQFNQAQENLLIQINFSVLWPNQPFLYICRRLKSRLKAIILTMKNSHSLQMSHLDPNHCSLLHTYFPAAAKPSQSALPAPNDLFKQTQFIQEATNCTSNPHEQEQEHEHLAKEREDEEFGQNCINFAQAQRMKSTIDKMRLIEQCDQTNQVSQTMTRVQKIKLIPVDQQSTVKANEAIKAKINAQLKKEVAAALTEQKKKSPKQPKKKQNYVRLDEQDTIKLSIPPNKKVQEIFEKQPLRKRFSALLKDEQKYQIGYQHMKLIRILRSIDTTIQFVSMNKQRRTYFYLDLKKNMYQNGRQELTQKHIQQMMFIDDQLFKVEWQKNQKINAYDLLITLPPIKSEDLRLQNVRKLIVQYLLAQELQYLAAKNQEKFKVEGWVDGFNPNDYEIPTKSLPPHPSVKEAEIRAISLSKLEQTKNIELKSLLFRKKEEEDAKSKCSQQVVSMIFSKRSNVSIRQKLLVSIKEKEARQLQRSKTVTPTIDSSMLGEVCFQATIIYSGQRVSNIPKVTLAQALTKKLGFKMSEILDCLQIILEAKQIGFLKEIKTSSGMVVLQINRTKQTEIKNFIKGFKAS